MSINLFIWAIVILMGVDVFGRIICILRGDMAPKRTPTTFILDLAINTAFLSWAIAVLSSGAV